MTLVNACCAPCQQEINKNIENICLEWWRDIRYRRHIGRRRVENRPKTLPLSVRVSPGWRLVTISEHLRDPTGIWEVQNVPYEQHPAMIAMSAFKSPGILRDLSPEQSAKDYLAGWHWRHMEPTKLNPISNTIRAKITFDPVIFGRLIAKIAHGISVVRFGINGFQPFLSHIILGKDLSKMWYYVGGDPIRPPKPINSHLLTRIFIAPEQIERDLIFAEIRLFANLGAPIYYAIVGQNPSRSSSLQPYGGNRR
jgi:hypothetical protein